MKQLFLLILISIFAIACGKDDGSPSDPKPGDQADVLIPLAVGNSWYYDAYFVNSSTPSDSTKIESSYTTITSKFKVGAEDWYNLTMDGESDYAPITNRSDGAYYYGGPQYGAHLDLLYPTKVGDKHNGSIERETISINAKIKVPAGEFTCIQFEELDAGPIKSYVYYCPKVGLIQESHIVEITGEGAFRDTTWSHTVLTKYILK